MLSQTARNFGRLTGYSGSPVCRASAYSLSTSTSSIGLREEQQLAAALSDRLSSRAPEAAASALVDGLSSQHRAILLKALGSDAARTPDSYVDKLFKEADTQEPLQKLDK